MGVEVILIGHVLAVVGAQYGSEGKGVIVHHMADRFGVHVRVGGPNAGHSFKHDGQEWKMRSIPCGWTNPAASLIIGAGAILDPEVLAGEIEMLQQAGYAVRRRLYVDANAWCITSGDRVIEEAQGMRERIGSTLEGVGSARIARIKRNPDADHRFDKVAKEFGLEDVLHYDTAKMLNFAVDTGQTVLLEGTQGSGLSLVHGPWPYATSADTNAAQLAADCGLAPSAVTDVLLVIRTYPIRVGGNSGPLKDEISWKELSQRIGREVVEMTTVTKRIRRVGGWDAMLVARAQMLNRANLAALTFADYVDPEIEGRGELTPRILTLVEGLQAIHGFRVTLVGTGGPDYTVIER